MSGFPSPAAILRLFLNIFELLHTSVDGTSATTRVDGQYRRQMNAVQHARLQHA